MNNQDVHLPSLTYDELAQLVIVNLRKCPELVITIVKDPLLMDDYSLRINGDIQMGGNFRDILESLAEYEY